MNIQAGTPFFLLILVIDYLRRHEPRFFFVTNLSAEIGQIVTGTNFYLIEHYFRIFARTECKS